MATNTSDFFTFSKTAGTAKNLQKPTDGGDNNLWGGYINVDLDTIVGAVNATSDLIADANQNELVDFTATGSAVNHVGITNAATGNGPTIEAKGDDTNIDLNVSGKGTGALASTGAKLTSPKVITGVNDTNGNELVKVTATGSAVNEITVANAATGNGPTLSATGDDTNIDLNIAGKGTGDPKMVDLKVTNIKANDGTAGISIADSTGRLTVTETNPVIELGSNATFPGPGTGADGGHILQVVQDSWQGKTASLSNKNIWTATGLEADIQVSSGNMVLVECVLAVEIISSGTNGLVALASGANNTTVDENDFIINPWMIQGLAVADNVMTAGQYLHTNPQSSVPQRYKVFVRPEANFAVQFGAETGVGYFYNTLTLYEIQA